MVSNPAKHYEPPRLAARASTIRDAEQPRERLGLTTKEMFYASMASPRVLAKTIRYGIVEKATNL